MKIPGSGRKKGTPNKRNLMVKEIAIKIGVDPFEILMKIAAGDWKGLGYTSEVYFTEKPDGAVKMGYTITPEMRLQAAKEATQYIYSKRREDDSEEPIDITPESEEHAAIEAIAFIKKKYPKLLTNE